MTPLRWSDLRYISESPAHYLHNLDNPMVPTAAMRLGSLVHALVLGVAPNSFIVYEGQRRGNAWKEFKEEHSQVEIVTSDEWERACRCADAVKADPICGPLLQSGLKEHRLEWEVAGRKCAGTPDLNGDILVDLKVTQMANPTRLPWHARKMMWHGQVAWYSDAVETLGGTMDGHYLLAVTPKAPHLCVAYQLTDETLELGRRLWHSLFERLRTCEESNQYPGYAQDVIPLDIQDDEDLTLTIGGEEVDL